MSLESLIEDSGQLATITAEAPDGAIPAQDPTAAADRSDGNWLPVVTGVPCLVSPKSSSLQAFPGRNDARQAIVNARIYFTCDPVPTIGLSSRNRITVTTEAHGGPQVLGIYAVQGVINPNTMDRIFEADCERLRTP
jgi:hypothetical protein